MSIRVERTIRVVERVDAETKPTAYWRTRSATERLAETLWLRREGNDLFRGGNPPFVYECFPRRVDIPIGGVKASVIALDDLRRNKRAVGRLQDLADLENLEDVQ